MSEFRAFCIGYFVAQLLTFLFQALPGGLHYSASEEAVLRISSGMAIGTIVVVLFGGRKA